MATAIAERPGMNSVQFDVPHPDQQSRLLIFVKIFLAVPHFIILYALNTVLSIITFVAFFAILFTRQYPEGLFKFAVGIARWRAPTHTCT